MDSSKAKHKSIIAPPENLTNDIMNKSAASANPIVNLNVGGEKMSTSRATLTVVKESSLATMFSGKSEDELEKDADGCIFLDHDPVVSRNFECSCIILSLVPHVFQLFYRDRRIYFGCFTKGFYFYEYYITKLIALRNLFYFD